MREVKNEIKISGVIITFNEERNIKRCLKSLEYICDEIVVVDSYSTDRTKSICEQFDIRFIEHKFEGHIEQKNFALDQAQFDYVLSLDADEEISEALSQSILAVKSDCQHEAFKFNRFTNFCGQWIKHCGWYPDTKVRLWKKTLGRWGGTNPHDSVELQNIEPIHLKGDLNHYSYYALSEFFERSLKYAHISAHAMNKQGRKAPLSKILGSTIFRFFKDYILNLGILDGLNGLIICGTNSHTTFVKYIYLRALNKGRQINE